MLNRLSSDLNIGYVAKDSLKELLGDTLRVDGESTDPYFYGDASVSALYAIVRSFLPSNKVLIIENAFWYELANQRISELVSGSNATLLQVYVTCDYGEAIRRFNHRREVGERHSIHPDVVYKEKDIETNKQKYRALDIEGMKTYTIDTTHPSEDGYQALVDWLKAETGGENETSN